MKAASSAVNVLGLPPLHRKIVLALLRQGPTDPAALAQILAVEQTALQTAIDTLLVEQQVRMTSSGAVELVLGRTRRRTLPARLWPALQAVSRLYSEQDIVSLRTAIPILQFTRAKLGEFTDHGPGHVLRVKLFATQLGSVFALTAPEQQLLRAASLFHDIGNMMERERHHIISQEMVEKLAEMGQLPFSAREATLVALICRWHRKEYDPDRRDEIQGETIRTGLLASLLRIADALDSDFRRFDYSGPLLHVLEFFFPHELVYWYDLNDITGIRICCTPELRLQLFMRAEADVEQNYYVRALFKDVGSTPIACGVDIFRSGSPNAASVIPNSKATRQGQPPGALLVSMVDPHSLVMAALSRKQLQAAGYTVECLVYPDTDGATGWLWGEALNDFSPVDFAELVVIGDRPDAALTPLVINTLSRWQAEGVRCTVLNRHEANWGRVSALLELGVTVTLGGDWAYFWGDVLDEAGLFWGRIASLCTRDPIQATIGLTAEEETISQGLRKALYDLARQSPVDLTGWVSLVLPLFDRIAADDRAWFVAQADDFVRVYANLGEPGQVVGQVLRFDLTTCHEPHTIFWGLEQAIERNGRLLERGIRFNTPYAIAAWRAPDDASAAASETVEVLAISHWREEVAIPIRLLYPTELGPAPEGNESAIRVRLPAAQATTVLQALVDACNRESLQRAE